MVWSLPLFWDVNQRQFPSDRQKSYMWLSVLSIIRKRTKDGEFEKVKPVGDEGVAVEVS